MPTVVGAGAALLVSRTWVSLRLQRRRDPVRGGDTDTPVSALADVERTREADNDARALDEEFGHTSWGAASTLKDIANAYAEIYDWHVIVRDGAFHDAGGAPTAGPLPYEVYAVVPTTAFVFDLDETVSPTRWVFAEASA
jgi:hypothetical protein